MKTTLILIPAIFFLLFSLGFDGYAQCTLNPVATISGDSCVKGMLKVNSNSECLQPEQRWQERYLQAFYPGAEV